MEPVRLTDAASGIYLFWDANFDEIESGAKEVLGRRSRGASRKFRISPGAAPLRLTHEGGSRWVQMVPCHHALAIREGVLRWKNLIQLSMLVDSDFKTIHVSNSASLYCLTEWWIGGIKDQWATDWRSFEVPGRSAPEQDQPIQALDERIRSLELPFRGQDDGLPCDYADVFSLEKTMLDAAAIDRCRVLP